MTGPAFFPGEKILMPIRILLADDHVLLRQGTAALLRREPDLEIVGEANNGQEAIELAQTLLPDIVVMDVRMPQMSGIEATRYICATLPAVRVLVLTAHDDEQYGYALFQAGASGYLLKSAPIGELITAIRQIMAGETLLAAAMAHTVIAPPAASPASPENDRAPRLTMREMEVLQMLARGLSNRAIAEALSVSDRTVQTHLTNIFAKMGVTSRLEAVLTAIRRGWLTLGG